MWNCEISHQSYTTYWNSTTTINISSIATPLSWRDFLEIQRWNSKSFMCISKGSKLAKFWIFQTIWGTISSSLKWKKSKCKIFRFRKHKFELEWKMFARYKLDNYLWVTWNISSSKWQSNGLEYKFKKFRIHFNYSLVKNMKISAHSIELSY